MKERKTVRMFCLLLSLLLVSQFAVTAFAATTTPWTDSEGYENYGVLTRTGTSAINIWETSPSVTHTQGTDTSLNCHMVQIHYTTDFGMDSYWGNFQPVLAAEQLSNTFIDGIELHPIQHYHKIPANAPSGTYQLQAELKCYAGIWEVYRIEFDYPNIVASGVVNAPYAPSGNCTAYRLVST